VVDFSNPGAAKEIAFTDPAPLPDMQLVLGGDWSDYWYNGRIYESDSPVACSCGGSATRRSQPPRSCRT
jgi:hypothetical protein